MIPKITCFVSTPSTNNENKIVKSFVELGFAPLVDGQHKKDYNWFITNLKNVPYKFFHLDMENCQVFYYDCKDLNESMNFSPNIMINYNCCDTVEDEDWRCIYEWLKFNLLNDKEREGSAKRGEEFMMKPLVATAFVDDVKIDIPEECYNFRTLLVQDRDTMLYEIIKPNTDLPYTSVIRRFSQRGHKDFFPSLYVCSSWGVSRDDLPFLSFIWRQLEMEGDFDIDKMLQEATEKCYPSNIGVPEPEPEVYRRNIEDVLNTLQCQEDGILCGHLFNDVPEEIKKRFT